MKIDPNRAENIRQILDGKTPQFRPTASRSWVDVDDVRYAISSLAMGGGEWRIKPEPVIVEEVVAIYENLSGGFAVVGTADGTGAMDVAIPNYGIALKLRIDVTEGSRKIVGVEVLYPK